MQQTLELTIDDLLERLGLGQIPMTTQVQVTFETDTPVRVRSTDVGRPAPDNLSPRQKIYVSMMRYLLPIARNHAGNLRRSSMRDFLFYWKSYIIPCSEITQLLHGIPVLLYKPEASDADVWFINVHVKSFVHSTDKHIACYRSYVVHNTRLLIGLMPADLAAKINWELPEFSE